MVEEDRVRLARVRTPHDDEVRVLRLPVGAGAATCSENCRQTDDTRGVSSAVTRVDVVAAHDGTGESLRRVVHLVRRLGAAEHPERLRGVVLPGEGEPGGCTVQGLVPARGAQFPVHPDQRFRQPYLLAHRTRLSAIRPAISGSYAWLYGGFHRGKCGIY